MKTPTALALAAIGGVIALLLRDRLTSLPKHGMQYMMAKLPEDSPPKLVMSILPKLKTQNDEIIAMLRELNELLRAQKRSTISRTRTSE